MYLHIQFADKSNPYVAYGEKKELQRKIKRWEKNYNLSVEEKEEGFEVLAEEKEGAKDLFSVEEEEREER